MLLKLTRTLRGLVAAAWPQPTRRFPGMAATLLTLGLAAMTDVRSLAAAPGPAIGSTQIAQWPGGRKAAFTMMFDDACPSHIANVFPELQKRKMVGTFYPIPNKGEYKSHRQFWEEQAPALPGVVYGNHTFSHKAFTDMEHAEGEIVKANEVLLKLFPGKSPRLISYVSPGGAKHAITQDQIKQILSKHNLILRPAFQGHGAAIHYKTGEDILKAVDKAIAAGTMEYVIFHGVGGDWISFDRAQFVALLDGLEARDDSVWITDHISAHKYQTQREAAKVAVLSADPQQIRLDLACPADAALYDQPLTLSTRVPGAWSSCRVTQGERVATVAVQDGIVRFEALPGAITLSPLPAK